MLDQPKSKKLDLLISIYTITMSIKIEIIKAILDINLPRTTKVTLSKNLFYFPTEEKTGGAKDSNYPYFTFDVKYSVDKLKSIGSHKARVYHFFNDMLFRKILDDQQIANDDNDRKENANFNVMCMLGCMFPTYFPIEGNLQGSFETKIERNFFSNNNFMFPDSQFSYIKIGLSTYTVTRALWVNDIINNKDFRKLLDKVLEYNRWELKKRAELTKQIADMQKKFDETDQALTEKTRKVISRLIELKTSFSDRSRILYEPYIIDLIGSLTKVSNSSGDEKLKYILLLNKSFKNTPSDIKRYISTNEFASLYEPAKKLQSEKLVLKILENPEKRKEYEKDRDVLVKLKEYSNLSDVIDSVKKYATPHRISSNSQLQSLIEKFVSGKSELQLNNLREFVRYVNLAFLSKQTSAPSLFSRDLLHSGVLIKNLPYIREGKLNNRTRQIEINVKLNVFKGILTESKIECIHRNAVLENTYKHLKENGDNSRGIEIEDQSHLYLDMTRMLNKKKGGKYTIKKNKKTENKTRRSR